MMGARELKVLAPRLGNFGKQGRLKEKRLDQVEPNLEVFLLSDQCLRE
jgi:hypothetical protein